MIVYFNRIGLRWGAIASVLVLSCMVMGCGQSGPLYLPGETPPIKVPKVPGSP